ncbi:MAG: hypothetical protein L3J44_08525, partial [Campylobacteraceae bacterium]|nr:hypothetical protein [Campylobacteraceae bacterium]
MKTILFVFAIIFISFSGCSSKESVFIKLKNRSDTDMYKNFIARYKQYWNAFSHKDFKKSYYIELPHQRFIHSME